MKVCIVGHFGGKKQFFDGQTIKTKEIFFFLKNKGMNMSLVDTYFLKRNPISIVFKLRKCFRENDVIILISSFRGYSILAPLMAFYNSKFKKRIYDFVIGGTRYQLFDKNQLLKKSAKQFNGIYVESERILKEYNKRGFENVSVIPNFKNIKQFPAKSGFAKKGELHACIFSRILKEKGVVDAIEAIKICNNSSDKMFYLDIYGNVEDGFKSEFDELVHGAENVSYNGTVSFDKSSSTIEKYDLLLFPTYWRSEGFPGTLIDAFFASVAIIATDWNDNFVVLEENKNAIKVDIKSPKQIADAMERLASDEKMFVEMSKANHAKAMEYLPDNVMELFMNELIGARNE